MGQDASSYAHISIEDKIRFLEEVESPIVHSLPITYDKTAGLPAVHVQAVESEFAKLYTEAKKEASQKDIEEFESGKMYVDETPVGATSDHPEGSDEPAIYGSGSTLPDTGQESEEHAAQEGEVNSHDDSAQ